MFDTTLTSTAQKLVDQLKTIDGVGTVAFIEDDDESMRYPVELPAVFVCLEKVSPGQKIRNNDQGWAMVVRSQKLMGTTGCLTILEKVLDDINGFDPGNGIKPLKLQSVELYDKKYQSVAYIARFQTVATGANR